MSKARTCHYLAGRKNKVRCYIFLFTFSAILLLPKFSPDPPPSVLNNVSVKISEQMTFTQFSLFNYKRFFFFILIITFSTLEKQIPCNRELNLNPFVSCASKIFIFRWKMSDTREFSALIRLMRPPVPEIWFTCCRHIHKTKIVSFSNGFIPYNLLKHAAQQGTFQCNLPNTSFLILNLWNCVGL